METTAFKKDIQGEVEGELQGQQRSSKDLWFLLEKWVQKTKTSRCIRIEKGGHYILDQTLLLTAQMVNSCKSKDHQEGKKERVIPIKVNRHTYTYPTMLSLSFIMAIVGEQHGLMGFVMLCKILNNFLKHDSSEGSAMT